MSIGGKVSVFKDKDFSSLWVVLPQICRNTKLLEKLIDECYNLGARNFLVENYYGFELLKRYKDVKIGSGSFVYIMNEYATMQLKEIGVEWGVVAIESSLENTSKIEKASAIEIKEQIGYRVPLFTSAVCIRKNDCKNCKGGIKRFELKKDGRIYEAISKDCQVQVFRK